MLQFQARKLRYQACVHRYRGFYNYIYLKHN